MNSDKKIHYQENILEPGPYFEFRDLQWNLVVTLK